MAALAADWVLKRACGVSVAAGFFAGLDDLDALVVFVALDLVEVVEVCAPPELDTTTSAPDWPTDAEDDDPDPVGVLAVFGWLAALALDELGDDADDVESAEP